MDLLPDEIIVNIFYFLNAVDVGIFMQLSSRIKDIVERNTNYILLPFLPVSVGKLHTSLEKDDMQIHVRHPADFIYHFDLKKDPANKIYVPVNEEQTRRFIGDYENLTYYELFCNILRKCEIWLSMTFPFNKSTLEDFGNAVADTQCNCTNIQIYLDFDYFEDVADCLAFLADKFKKAPPIRILHFGSNAIRPDWLPKSCCLAQKYNNTTFRINRFCSILHLIVESLLHRPDQPVDICLEYNASPMYNSCSDKTSAEHCVFKSANRCATCLSDVIPQLPPSFVEIHSLHNLPETMSFQAPFDCRLTLTKKGNYVYVRKTNC